MHSLTAERAPIPAISHPSTQRIVVGIPPNYAAIKARFPGCDRKGVIFSYGDTIFNPSAVSIPREIIVHEATHGLRQQDQGVERWWKRYIEEPFFLLDEELYAHRNEYKALVRRHGPGPKYLRRVAGRLAGPLYGNLLTLEQAMHAILTGEVKCQ